MPYATKQNIDDRYGAERLLVIADRDGDGVADTAAIDLALGDATDEINVYLAAGSRYTLPLASVPEILVRLCVDIAVYRLAASADVLTDEITKRYEDAVKLLARIGKGEVSLGVENNPAQAAQRVNSTSQPRVFTRERRLF